MTSAAKFNRQQQIITAFDLELIKSIPIPPTKKSSSSSSSSSSYSFEHAVRVYVNKPQVVNNWLAGSIVVQDEQRDQISRAVPAQFDPFAHFDHVETREFLSKSSKIFADIRYLIMLDANALVLVPLDRQDTSHEPDHEKKKKYPSPSFVHMIERDGDQALNLYVPKQKPNESSSSSSSSAAEAEADDRLRQIRWLTGELMPKLNNWSVNIRPDEEFTCANLNTLKLYPSMINDYWRLYQAMKSVYWHRFSPTWTQTTGTDPEKFIYEDIHIACYLILAWRHFECRVRRFVDLGCGNGLLVYILNDQGYNGYGVDMRERKIWSNEHFKAQRTQLVESTIDPSSAVFDDCDWLIGNHSDELSPYEQHELFFTQWWNLEL